ncbi:MAG: DUF917 domain-containing protein [SAR202 cluster bacterium]|nr:DUF917 domain-containing protein [SAR202 cluster bacterium]
MNNRLIYLRRVDLWTIENDSIESISIGAGILGSGGGGNPYMGMLRAKEMIRKYGPVNVLSVNELSISDKIVCVGSIGAPTVGIEKIQGIESYYALRAIEKLLNFSATAVVSNEIGGSNSLEPIIPASISKIPIVDADGMGRAFPELQMKTFFVYGVPPVPMSIADDKGNVMIISQANDPKTVEDMARSITVQMGSVACYAFGPMDINQILNTAVLNTLTLSKNLGDIVRSSIKTNNNPIESILKVHSGKNLFEGKIVDLERKTIQGFTRGKVLIEGLSEYSGDRMEIEFQNENLIAKMNNTVVCLVPDLICIVDSEKGEPITTELLRYGFRVTVLGFPAPKHWTSEQGLKVVGPKAFGYDFDYSPLLFKELK